MNERPHFVKTNMFYSGWDWVLTSDRQPYIPPLEITKEEPKKYNRSRKPELIEV